ncbi:hypothetical protein LZ480_14420 [Solibacillus sp. MA9]|uniref:IDEAL domain-containing protein n=1 Tax=Solibacillus palustris TaxID=2908203 RepID=A0ABS9UG08_9BACL|nr:hypothetical protein [Solibacillus sp. MA9]MCH7323070.1 hypothetical protein [Solibacillus sp. MA9]
MNHFDEEEHVGVLPIEDILRQLTKEHISDFNHQENNNSFIFLEKSSLNLLLTYLLSKPQTEPPTTPEINVELQAKSEASVLKAIEEIDQLMNDNEKEFQAILRLLKEIT